MNISAWAIKRPLPALLVFFVLCVAGLWGFYQLPVARFPDIAFPMTTVTVTQPGASPSQLEAEVTRKVEDSVATVNNVKRVISSVSEGVSTTTIEFQLEADLATALDDTRDAITRIRTDLPQDIQEPVISKVDIGGSLMTYALVAPHMTADEASWFVDRDVSRAMYGVPGVARVTRVGGVQRQVRVDLDPNALMAMGITAGDVSGQLARIQVERAGGKAEIEGAQQTIRTLGTVGNAQALRDYSIALPDGRAVRLSTLATITDAAADPTEAALLDGGEVVALSMSRTRGSSEVKVEKGVHAALDAIKAEHPGIDFRLVTTAIDETHRSYDSSMTMLWEGALLALLVVWLFLRDWRATWVSALALPLSIIPTFAVMHLFGFTLNMITLLALSVVVGILVDDAIVEIENIVRHLRMGKPPLEAAREAAGEIGNAVIATSLTLAAVFVPVAFMPGIAGKFFREFGWTAATAVLFSLLVARLLTPMMAAYLLKPHGQEPPESRLMTWYLGWVDAALRHRGRTLWLATGLFVASLALVPFIPATFIPQSDLGRSNLNLELPPGTRLQETVAVAERARALLKDMPELKQVYTAVGSVLDLGDPGATGVGEPRKATLVLDWGTADTRDRDQRVLEREARQRLANLPGVRVSYVSSEPGNLLQLVLSGDDPQRLQDASTALERDLRGIQGLGSVTSTASLLRPEIQIVPDAARAADLGVATADIAEAARIATAGDYEQRLAKLNLPDRQVPIRVGFAEATLANPALIGQLRVPGRYGPVPLAAVADIQQGSGPSQISRYQRQRNVTLTAELNGRPLGEVMAEVQALPGVKQLPPGVTFLNTGDAEVFVELFVGFLLAMAAGLICIYMVLLLLFNHALMPITILAAVPLCAGGAFGALLITQNMLSLPALIGLLMLIGIATKNSILLVDYAVMAEDEHGMSQHDALIDACRKRAQPIIMTTLAMGAGMMPIALGFAGDSSFRAPMAIAVIGGLITSTLLSLIVIPAAFTVVDDLGDWLSRRFRHRSSHSAGHAAD
ncbi:efflux RND transporter permease subunit [Stenotrophomonas rhizophila]|uniref:efflux RND transporter permease subunit n=1 Tax=Stenotrophomonas rhizophila TaxID=216778 RepID=UPI001E55E9C5|nr:efflux RND transporter permease subunit [Stenotrophomonas rhizophila]MCC7633165.1 efflux RND transporter permease subunit [Stenotrophomonas rhizophila]MCC7662058.1 efflux RND transporter permease subunit [Stenotrophomonas rhizophila]